MFKERQKSTFTGTTASRRCWEFRVFSTELEKLHSFEIRHAAADALITVKANVGLVSVRIAEQLHAQAAHDGIRALQIAERDQQRARSDGRHALAVRDGV